MFVVSFLPNALSFVPLIYALIVCVKAAVDLIPPAIRYSPVSGTVKVVPSQLAVVSVVSVQSMFVVLAVIVVPPLPAPSTLISLPPRS